MVTHDPINHVNPMHSLNDHFESKERTPKERKSRLHIRAKHSLLNPESQILIYTYVWGSVIGSRPCNGGYPPFFIWGTPIFASRTSLEGWNQFSFLHKQMAHPRT